MHGNRASVETDVEFPGQSGRAVWRVMGVFESQLKSLAEAFAFVRRIHRCTISCCNMKVSFLNDHTDCYIWKEYKLTINTPARFFRCKSSPNFLLWFCVASVQIRGWPWFSHCSTIQSLGLALQRTVSDNALLDRYTQCPCHTISCRQSFQKGHFVFNIETTSTTCSS